MFVVHMEAHVGEDQWDALIRAYTQSMKHRHAANPMSLLLQDSVEPTLWRVMSAWESREVQ